MTSPRVVVRPTSVADRRWQEHGRSHFLNQDMYTAKHGQPKVAALPPVEAPPVWLEQLPTLMLPLILLWALWTYTMWSFPFLKSLLPSPRRVFLYPLRRLIRGFWIVCWSRPVAQYGIGITLWCWWCVWTLLTGLVALTTGSVFGLLFFALCVCLAVVWWYALRWWRQRQFRPRPMPGRRR